MSTLIASAVSPLPSTPVSWTPCGFSFPFESDNKTTFECTNITVPLCHPGFCEMEESMAQMYHMFNGSVSFYTSDHRGTGRSFFLQCANSSFVDLPELPECFGEALSKIDGHVNAFSASSAATDHKIIMQQLISRDTDLFIHGVSYGTNVLQRLVQIAPSIAKRFIFDGVDVATTKTDPFQSDYAHRHQYIMAPSRRLLEACFDDPTCPLKFKSRSTTLEEVLALYKRLDDEIETNACSKTLVEGEEFSRPRAL
ncbi:hypothetical protein P43SY_006076 [Pythium insidiosum]|uniref:AB hydrolase-1 domain-containing protein n=1 Tax=Pythium insidiosum TaxID=114742 RepID=A0AAD5LFB0_PYTIN|nr:hypothetical protein P43SY_006076 [Pythium insidiosum]